MWRRIQRGLDPAWKLDQRELVLLENASKIADVMADLEQEIAKTGVTSLGSKKQTIVNPAIAELRQQGLAQLRILQQIELVDPLKGRQHEPIRSQRARTAARARWRKGDPPLRSVSDG